MTDLRADMLFGASKVAEFIGVDPRKVYHWMDRRKAGKRAPPLFDVGGEVCGRKTELSSWFSGYRDLSSPEAPVGRSQPPESKKLGVNPDNADHAKKNYGPNMRSKTEQTVPESE